MGHLLALLPHQSQLEGDTKSEHLDETTRERLGGVCGLPLAMRRPRQQVMWAPSQRMKFKTSLIGRKQVSFAEALQKRRTPPFCAVAVMESPRRAV